MEIHGVLKKVAQILSKSTRGQNCNFALTIAWCCSTVVAELVGGLLHKETSHLRGSLVPVTTALLLAVYYRRLNHPINLSSFSDFLLVGKSS
jgi:hypothetical protein